jgi:hypothetical protein
MALRPFVATQLFGGGATKRLSFCTAGFRKQAARCSTDVSSRTSSGSMRLAPAAT